MDSVKQIKVLRTKIDEIDHKILDLYQQRLETVVQIAQIKVDQGMDAEQPDRLLQIRQDRLNYIESSNIKTATLEKLITLFHDDAVAIQQVIIFRKSSA